MTKLIEHMRPIVLLLWLSMTFLMSCTQESEIQVEDLDVFAQFDSKLEEVIDLMDSNPALAIENLDLLISDAESINSDYYSGKSKWFKAYIYDEIEGNVAEAYRLYNDALEDILKTDDTLLKKKIYNNLGLLYRFYGDYSGAVEIYNSALLLESDLDEKSLSDLYYNLGVVLKLRGDETSFIEAEQAFTRSLEFAEEVNYRENIASIHNQIGLMYKALKNYELARTAYDNTINTYVSDSEMLDYVGKAYHGIGVTFMDEGKLEAAIRAFQKALEYKSISGSIFITKYDLGTVLLRAGKVEEAVTVWKNALNEKHNRNSREQVQIYADLTSVLKNNNELEEALTYSEVYNQSIQNILEEDEKYKAESDRVLFANVIKEYDEFNQPVPFFSRPLVILFSLLALVGIIYAIVYAYYRSRSKRKISEVVSDIQSEFLDIKVD